MSEARATVAILDGRTRLQGETLVEHDRRLKRLEAEQLTDQEKAALLRVVKKYTQEEVVSDWWSGKITKPKKIAIGVMLFCTGVLSSLGAIAEITHYWHN